MPKRMFVAVVFIALAALFCMSALSAQDLFEKSFSGALAKAKAEKKLVLIDFFSGG